VHEVFADVGLLKKNEINLFQRMGNKKTITWQIYDIQLQHIWLLRWVMCKVIWSQMQSVCSETIASAKYQLTYFPKDRESIFFGTILIT